MQIKMEKEKQSIIDYGKKLVTKGLIKGTGGNISIYNRQEKLMAISPSSKDYFEIEKKDIVLMDLEGNIIEGEARPSTEWQMHLIYYKNRQDINSLVHTHSKYATIIASMRLDLEPIHYMIALAGKKVKCANYAIYGSKELAQNAYLATQDTKAVLLANHGLIGLGKNLKEAFNIAEQIEYVSEIYYYTKLLGGGKILTDQEIGQVIEKFNK